MRPFYDAFYDLENVLPLVTQTYWTNNLTWYYRELQCLDAVELKTVEFGPQHIGKINFCLGALYRVVKLPYESPSIGKGKDDEVVDISLASNTSSTALAGNMTNLIDKNLFQQNVKEQIEYEKATD